MNKDCYSDKMAMRATAVEHAINKLRIKHTQRVLWPDYEVTDLIQAGVSIEELTLFTSTSLIIVKITSPEELFEEPTAYKLCTHVAVHRTVELGSDLEKVCRYYVVLSKRGFAIDELNSRYVRGSYTISVQVAQIQRMVFLWGAESLSEDVRIITPKYVSRCGNSMWRLEFESAKPVKSLFFYSTKREPRYGKASTASNELPIDGKLEFCMKVRIFPSFLESIMSKEQRILDSVVHFISPRKGQIIFCPTAEGTSIKKGTEKKWTYIESSMNRQPLHESSSSKKQIRLRIINPGSFLEIHNTERQHLQGIDLRQVRQFIFEAQKSIMDFTLQDAQSLKQAFPTLKFQELRHFNWEQISSMVETVENIEQPKLYEFFIACMIHIFAQDGERTIDQWIYLTRYIQRVEQGDAKVTLASWLEALMHDHCCQLLKNCDEETFEALQQIEVLIKSSIKNCLEKCSQKSTQMSDLLFILMRIQQKNDIFDLYRSHRLANRSLLITSSLKKWQESNNLYPKHGSDVLYQVGVDIQTIPYQHREDSVNEVDVNADYDFSIVFTDVQLSNRSFISGKQHMVDNHVIKPFIYRKEGGEIYCFIEKVIPLAHIPFEQIFTSYTISIEVSVNHQKQVQTFGWSFNAPLHAIGTVLKFRQLQNKVNIDCKMSFRRQIIHESIMNYMRIRYEQLLKMKNKCSEKIQSENKRLLKRRSSFILERNLSNDVNFCNQIEQGCFLHHICHKCECLTHQKSIFKLQPLDLYKLMLSASFKDELDAFLVTIKYLIITPKEIVNRQFWLSQLRIQHLNLLPLLKLINKRRLDSDILEIVSSLIDEKMRQNGPKQQKSPSNLKFLKKNESRLGKRMWHAEQPDYSQEYLQFRNNAPRQ